MNSKKNKFREFADLKSSEKTQAQGTATHTETYTYTHTVTEGVKRPDVAARNATSTLITRAEYDRARAIAGPKQAAIARELGRDPDTVRAFEKKHGLR